jgi:HlyD family secretion protein
MRRRVIIVLAVLLIAGAAGFAWWYTHRSSGTGELVLYGNVDLRQADLAFTDSGRIAEVLAQEGDVVKQGQLLARLDVSRLTPQIAQAEAQLAAQKAAVDKLHHGSRPEEIAQARASVDAAKADADNARTQSQRLSSLASSPSGRASVTERDVDAAKAAEDSADARLEVAQRSYDLVVAGPRAEDIAQAEAQLQASEAQLAFLKQQLKDADLTAPVAGVVRSRLMEPGEMTSPLRPIFSLAVVDPKWVRAYAAEPDLARIGPGMRASITVDGLPGKSFDGWIGFISPVAEFTPKAVQTEELRTSLVYEVRVFVKDAGNTLRLGMPATVRLAEPAQTASNAGEATP